MPFSTHSTAFIMPANPEADSRCPIFAFTEPMIRGFEVLLDCASVSAIALTSIGSPTFYCRLRGQWTVSRKRTPLQMVYFLQEAF